MNASPNSSVRPRRSPMAARTRRARSPSAGTTRTASSVAGGLRIICALRCATGIRSAGRAAIPSAARRFCGPGITAPMRWRSRAPRPTSPSSCSACSTCPSSPSTTSTPRRKARSLAESVANLNAIADLFEEKMASAKVRLLWGTANLFTHRRYMAGAATNPDPDVFTYAAGQVRAALEVTHRLGGQNYVLWGGREGYETLLNTDIEPRARSARPLRLAGRRAQAQDRLQGPDPDRAEAEGADQASIRFRRRHLLRLPPALRPPEATSSSTSSRTMPSSPAIRSSTRSRSPRRSAYSARSTSTAATICSAGIPTSSR